MSQSLTVLARKLSGITTMAKICLVCLLLSTIAIGCTQRPDSPKSLADKRLKVSLLSGKKESPPRPLWVQETDSQSLSFLNGRFFSLVRDGKKAEAAKLFLPKTRRTALMTLARDVELAGERPAEYAPRNVEFVWHQNGKLWLRRGAQKLTDEEIDRLITLSKSYEKAFVIVTASETGKLTKILTVKYRGKYWLLP